MNVPPATPAQGARIRVQTGTHWSIGVDYSISAVNSRSFYVSYLGKTERRLLPEWRTWLLERFSEGRVFLDGTELQCPPDSASWRTRVQLDVRAVDSRFLRAAHDVGKRYGFAQARNGSMRRVTVTGGSKDYEVSASVHWDVMAECTCPDAKRLAHGGFCKHVIAVLMRDADLRCQLIDVLL